MGGDKTGNKILYFGCARKKLKTLQSELHVQTISDNTEEQIRRVKQEISQIIEEKTRGGSFKVPC